MKSAILKANWLLQKLMLGTQEEMLSKLYTNGNINRSYNKTYVLDLNSRSRVQYSKNELTVSAPQKFTIEELKSLNHLQVLDLLQEEISQLTRAALEKPFDDKLNNYPFNALNGNHLFNAIQVFNTNLQYGTCVATENMIEYLLQNQTTDSDSAESIANWLLKFIEVQQYPIFKELKNSTLLVSNEIIKQFYTELCVVQSLNRWRSSSDNFKQNMSPDLQHILNAASYPYPIFKELENSPLKNSNEIFEQFYTELCVIRSLDRWRSLSDNFKQNMSPNLQHILNFASYPYPIFKELENSLLIVSNEIFKKFYTELCIIQSLDRWRSMSDDSKQNMSPNLQHILNFAAYPIFNDLFSLIRDDSFLKQYSKEIALVGSYDNWLRSKNGVSSAVRDIIDKNGISLANLQFKKLKQESSVLYMETMKALESTRDNKEMYALQEEQARRNLHSLRGRFYDTWNTIFINSTIPNIDSIFREVDEDNLIGISSIRNDEQIKSLLQDFYIEPNNRNERIPVPVVGNSIQIQYFGLLDNTTKQNDSYFKNSDKPNSFSIVIAPSGCGKTHEILKYGQSKYCLFFNGSLPVNSGALVQYTTEKGFLDSSSAYLVHICSYYQMQFNAEHFLKNFIVEYFTQLLVLSRLIYLDRLKNLYGDKLTPDLFLLAQLNGNSIAYNVFRELIEAHLSESFVRSQIHQLLKKYNVFAVLDEANVFTSFTIMTVVSYNFTNHKIKPFLTAFAKSLIDSMPYVVFAGTTLDVSTALSVMNAVGKKQEPLNFQGKFMQNTEEIEALLTQVINIKGCEHIIVKHSNYLFGTRVRLFMKIIALLPNYTKIKSLSKAEQFDKATESAITIFKDDIKFLILRQYTNSFTSQLERNSLVKILAEFVYQFTSIGYFKKEFISVQSDLVNLALCEIQSRNNEAIKYYYSTDKVALEAAAQFLLEQKQAHAIVSHFVEVAKSFDSNQSPKGYTLELFFASLLVLRSFAGKTKSTEFHINYFNPSALINWIPARLHNELSDDMIAFLTSTKCETHTVRHYQQASQFVEDVEPNTIYILNSMSAPDILLYTDEYILAFAFNTSNSTCGKSSSKSNLENLNLNDIIASKKTKSPNMTDLNKKADSQSRVQLKIAIFSDNDSSASSSIRCNDNEIYVSICNQDIQSLFPSSLAGIIGFCKQEVASGTTQ